MPYTLRHRRRETYEIDYQAKILPQMTSGAPRKSSVQGGLKYIAQLHALLSQQIAESNWGRHACVFVLQGIPFRISLFLSLI